MIQRIQTVFLVLVAASFGSLFALPFASSDIATSQVLADKIFDISDNVMLLILTAVGALLAIVSIFMYKKRKTQLRLGYFMIILAILIPVAAYFIFLNDTKEMNQEAVITDQFGAYIPFIAIALAIAANYFIRKDDKLVKSMDRLR